MYLYCVYTPCYCQERDFFRFSLYFSSFFSEILTRASGSSTPHDNIDDNTTYCEGCVVNKNTLANMKYYYHYDLEIDSYLTVIGLYYGYTVTAQRAVVAVLGLQQS